MAGILSIRQAGPLITTLVGSHIAFSLASIARAGIGGIQAKHKSNIEREIEECFDAKHYDLVTDFVARMYRGQGIKALSRNDNGKKRDGGNVNAILGVKLASTAKFEDPAAICVSEEEIREAFRALKALDPVSLSPPRCINVIPRGESIDLTFQLNQQYTLPMSRKVSFKSLLTVRVQLQQMRDIGLPESEFLITEMKELW
eukprot:CAMPEP_0197174582 /NCGR_PEP_ID=MMETSP1423-20130617/1037_1 /TAXON_ID=476441 /ORGANISM="Pseudo-nitzschia heimii, Strain UNC1101" /LENGTH=200 /DNA_ID=CAMNT_0042623525 /DNA_START=36 /DNA_END=635 /DNA_ORIENTATION=+